MTVFLYSVMEDAMHKLLLKALVIVGSLGLSLNCLAASDAAAEHDKDMPKHHTEHKATEKGEAKGENKAEQAQANKPKKHHHKHHGKHHHKHHHHHKHGHVKAAPPHMDDSGKKMDQESFERN